MNDENVEHFQGQGACWACQHLSTCSKCRVVTPTPPWGLHSQDVTFAAPLGCVTVTGALSVEEERGDSGSGIG